MDKIDKMFEDLGYEKELVYGGVKYVKRDGWGAVQLDIVSNKLYLFQVSDFEGVKLAKALAAGVEYMEDIHSEEE